MLTIEIFTIAIVDTIEYMFCAPQWINGVYI